jgi:hypothetical protein
MCIPMVTAPTDAEGECVHGAGPAAAPAAPGADRGRALLAPWRRAFLRVAAQEDAAAAECSFWARMTMRANANIADVSLPILFVLYLNASAALLPWWTAVVLAPGAMITVGALQYAAGMVPGAQSMRPRLSVVMVVSLLVSGVSVFLTRLAPAMAAEHGGAVMLEAAMFALNALVFWKTVFTDPGFVPVGTAAAGPVPPEARVCNTCRSVRPVRSKHDPFSGRCVRCAPHPHTRMRE